MKLGLFENYLFLQPPRHGLSSKASEKSQKVPEKNDNSTYIEANPPSIHLVRSAGSMRALAERFSNLTSVVELNIQAGLVYEKMARRHHEINVLNPSG